MDTCKACCQRGRQDHLHADFGLLARIGKPLSPPLQQPAVDGKEQKLIGKFFARRVYMNDVAQLDGMTHRFAIARNQLDGIHCSPPGGKDHISRRLSSFHDLSATEGVFEQTEPALDAGLGLIGTYHLRIAYVASWNIG